MDALLNFIKGNIDGIIIILGLAILILLCWNGSRLANQKNKIKDAVSRKNYIYRINKKDRVLEENEDETAVITPDTVRDLETNFNMDCSWHNVFAQFIPIFPLLGILGTVAGLMLELKSEDISIMISSLNTALSSTFWGVIFAIILKAVDALYPARIVNDTEVLLDDYYQKMNLADRFDDSKEDK